MVLPYLFPSGKTYFDASAQEAAISRLYCGIHYQIDNDAGLDHGTRIGGHTVRFAQQDGADPETATATATKAGQTLDGASFHSPVAAGSIATVFQTNLGSPLNVANTVPLPTSLNGVSVNFSGSIPVPLFAATQNQANIQIPWELLGLSYANLTTNGSNGGTNTLPVSLSAFAPAIFSPNQQGTGQGLVTISNSSTLVAPPGSIGGATTRAATNSDFITIYCVGLGPVNNPRRQARRRQTALRPPHPRYRYC